jgi:D-alanyl-D-alanine carboxypeptidase (penicillin-binding protein 5/6)
MKRIFLNFISVLTLVAPGLGATPISNVKNIKKVDPPVKAYLVINADTGDVLSQKNPDFSSPPASLTKLMTLYITLDAIKSGKVSWEQIYAVPKWISQIGGSEAKMWHGEKISVRDLFKAAAVGSANDAAAALAEIVSGSQQKFVDQMNQKASELGLSNTVFRTPHGLPVRNGGPKDRTTPTDLVKLSLAIFRHHPEILQYTGAKETYIRKGKWRFINTNKLIGKYPGMNGLKTGYTDEAKYCLVAAAKQGDLRLISVVLGANSNKERFLYTQQLLDNGFYRFKNVFVPCKGKSFEISIPDSEKTYDSVEVKDNLFFMAPKEKASQIQLELFIPNSLTAPILKGEKIAEYVASVDGQIIARTEIRTKEDVKKAGFFKRLFGG